MKEDVESNKLRLLEDIALLADELMSSAEVDEKSKEILLNQEVLEDLWECVEDYQEFLEQGAALQ